MDKILTTGWGVFGSASVECAPCQPRTLRENSMTAHWRPKHTPNE